LENWAILEKGPRAIHLLLEGQQSFGNMPLNVRRLTKMYQSKSYKLKKAHTLNIEIDKNSLFHQGFLK